MSDAPLPTDPMDDIAEPKIRKRKWFSIVWLIPLVAAIAAGWMAYDALQQEGQTVTIRFNTAEGLIPGKTKIKFKDVEVGQVEAIKFSKDLAQVIVTAKMAKSMDRYLRSHTKFWVVRARVTPSEVSGLGTLFSGVYIGIQPTKKGKLMWEFEGLDAPPVVSDEHKGRQFVLRTKSLGSLDVGVPVYFRRVRVGQVTGYELLADDTIEVGIFIEAPHHKRVFVDTKFWNASGVDLTMDARGVRLQTESMISLLMGGVAFGRQEASDSVELAPQGTTFTLYPSREASFDTAYSYKERYLLHFDSSVRGLTVDAPVEFRGMTIGKVLDVKLQLDMNGKVARIPVLVEIEPQRFDIEGMRGGRDKVVPTLLDMGLRAQLGMGNVVTGSSYVSLDLHPELGTARLKTDGRYPELPTMPSPIEGILTNAASIMKKVDQVPFATLSKELRATMDNIRETMVGVHESMASFKVVMDKTDDQQILSRAGAMMDSINKTMAKLDKTLDPESDIQADTARLLRELTDAARSLRMLVDYLERQPDALLYGKDDK